MLQQKSILINIRKISILTRLSENNEALSKFTKGN